MSQLRVFEPSLTAAGVAVQDPPILPFRPSATRSSRRQDVVTRARLLFENRECPECGYPVVEPLELNDAVLGRNGRPIPGSATLVGFRCCGCDCEWSV